MHNRPFIGQLLDRYTLEDHRLSGALEEQYDATDVGRALPYPAAGQPIGDAA